MTAEQLKELEDKLWHAADKLRADSELRASQYSTPVLGLIFLRFASIKYNKVKDEVEKEFEAQKNSRRRREKHEIALEKCGLYLPPQATYEYLLELPEEKDIAKAIKEAMEQIESYKDELKGSLPKEEYYRLVTEKDRSLPKSLLKIFADIPEDVTGDVFGKIYEYFLAEFALAEGQGGGEFFTPTSVVKLMVEIIEPYSGTIFDPACGSGGMFVQSSQFVERRKQELHETGNNDLVVYGTEKTSETAKLARMNLAINNLRGQVEVANSYYEDPYESYGNFDYVMANPPFNVDEVQLDRVKNQPRFNEYGIPQNKTKKSAKKKKEGEIDTVPNANYLWINLFATSLKEHGRAALVMANSASDARHSEADIRENLIRSGVIDVMVTLPKNMFYTVTLPATLWFFDKSHTQKPEAERKVLFIDARNIFRQITRAHREFTEEQIQNIATIVRLYRGEQSRLKELLKEYKAVAKGYEQQAAKQAEALNKLKAKEPAKNAERTHERDITVAEQKLKELQDRAAYFTAQLTWWEERFPAGEYEDVTGLCKLATLSEIEEQDYSLNPGRYVGVVIEEDGLTEEEFKTEMKERHEQLKALNEDAEKLADLIMQNNKLFF